jgi:hypothetical protein
MSPSNKDHGKYDRTPKAVRKVRNTEIYAFVYPQFKAMIKWIRNNLLMAGMADCRPAQ